MSSNSRTEWHIPFLSTDINSPAPELLALIILNQPFSLGLLRKLWSSATIRCCADGGANRLHDLLHNHGIDPKEFLPDFIKGDMDSIREEVRAYFHTQGVPILEDHDQFATDLMKCVHQIETMEKTQDRTFTIVLLGGLSGRLDQTIHTLSYLHKLRKKRQRTFAVTDDSIGWVLDSGEHDLTIDSSTLGPTCGLLPVGVKSTILSTTGLVWNLDNALSSFDGMMSTSNAVAQDKVWIKTSEPIWWCIELRPS